MKLFVLIFVLGLIAITNSKHTSEHIELFKQKMGECKTEQNVSDDVVGKFITKQITPEVKCFAACVMGKVGMINGDNTLNTVVALEGAKDFFGTDAELLKKLETIINACSGETDSDKCEAFYKIFNCFESKRIEEGIEMLF